MSSNRSAAIAAAIILLCLLAGGYYLPEAVNYVAQFSRWLALAIGVAFVLAVFVVLWLRARYQRRHEDD
ncbi:hypothetical protein [Martelella endophytica]|uniref:Uncharacterized protein n=1 Tax=Martelella endophytica TaxID=1486262 RepID=A0A0D5LPJ0_MAREN|nr:hypothetical protein [Martelella endophytica]AJY46041.1 hypothetical protein TM49_10745 [Martelella endophytica]